MTTLVECIDDFLTDLQHQRNLRPNTLAAYPSRLPRSSVRPIRLEN